MVFSTYSHRLKNISDPDDGVLGKASQSSSGHCRFKGSTCRS